MKQRIAQVSSR